jgi:hypothetical protein
VVIDARVADMRTVATTISEPVDAVIAFDDSVPHLLSDRDALTAFRSFYDCLRPGGICLLSVRDYAATARSDFVHAYGVRWRDGVKYPYKPGTGAARVTTTSRFTSSSLSNPRPASCASRLSTTRSRRSD